MKLEVKNIHVLILEDRVSTALGVATRVLEILEDQGYVVEITQCQTVDMVEEILEDGRIFDLALIDLGLYDPGRGTSQGSLGAIDMLSKASEKNGGKTKIVLHSDVTPDATRALVAYAAFIWFNDAVVTLIPGNNDLSPTIEQVLRGERRFPVADVFRRREATEAFSALFKEESAFKILSALAVTDSRQAAADRCNLSLKSIKTYISDHEKPFATLLTEARKANIIGKNGLEYDSESRQILPSLQKFMAMQYIFFNDPYVIAESQKAKKYRIWR